MTQWDGCLLKNILRIPLLESGFFSTLIIIPKIVYDTFWILNVLLKATDMKNREKFLIMMSSVD